MTNIDSMVANVFICLSQRPLVCGQKLLVVLGLVVILLVTAVASSDIKFFPLSLCSIFIHPWRRNTSYTKNLAVSGALAVGIAFASTNFVR